LCKQAILDDTTIPQHNAEWEYANLGLRRLVLYRGFDSPYVLCSCTGDDHFLKILKTGSLDA